MTKGNVTSLDLYRESAELCFELEANEGVTDDEIEARIGAFLDGSEAKLDRHRYAIDMFTNQAKMYRAESQRLSKRARMLEGIVERVKNHAKMVLEARVELLGDEGRRLETPNGIVYLRRGDKLVIEDETDFVEKHNDADFVTHKPQIDKRQLLKLLKTDLKIDGARVEPSVSVVFK